MTYKTIADMVEDGRLYRRIVGCASQELAAIRPQPIPRVDPRAWVAQNIWTICGVQSLIEKYESGIATNESLPDGEKLVLGEDQSVIGEADLLSAVQPLVLEDAASASSAAS